MTNEEIIEKYSTMVYRIAVSQVGNRDDADDIYQDVFLQLVRYVDRLESEEHIKHWLIRTTINRCKSYFLSPWMKKITALPERIPEEAAEESTGVFDLVMNLPAKYKSVIYLHYYEGYGVNEIAEILKIRSGTVKTRLFRARKMLEELLEDV